MEGYKVVTIHNKKLYSFVKAEFLYGYKSIYPPYAVAKVYRYQTNIPTIAKDINRPLWVFNSLGKAIHQVEYCSTLKNYPKLGIYKCKYIPSTVRMSNLGYMDFATEIQLTERI
jgi:hypothetical protein